MIRETTFIFVVKRKQALFHFRATAFPSFQNGNRVVKILLSKDILGFVQFDGFDCRVW